MLSTRWHQRHVYVVELDGREWKEPRFRKAEPDHRRCNPLVYVDMTGNDPDLRFDMRNARFKANRSEQLCGLCLLPALYDACSPMR